MTSGSGKKGKKSKQKGQRSAGHELSVHPRVNEYANSDVCAAALKGKEDFHLSIVKLKKLLMMKMTMIVIIPFTNSITML